MPPNFGQRLFSTDLKRGWGLAPSPIFGPTTKTYRQFSNHLYHFAPFCAVLRHLVPSCAVSHAEYDEVINRIVDRIIVTITVIASIACCHCERQNAECQDDDRRRSCSSRTIVVQLLESLMENATRKISFAPSCTVLRPIGNKFPLGDQIFCGVSTPQPPFQVC